MLSKIKDLLFGTVSVPAWGFVVVAVLATQFPVLTIGGTLVYILYPVLRQYIPNTWLNKDE